MQLRVIEIGNAWIATDVREGALFQVLLSPKAPASKHETPLILARESCPITRALADYLSGAEINNRGLTCSKEVLGSVTAFTRSIWHVLSTIPRGTVMSYGDIASAAGCPRGGRAAGNALNKNPFPIVMPCHRVILAQGRIGGFGSGNSWKKYLLDLEGIVFNDK